MKRKIISINEEKCTGCGICIPDCPEGALQILDGKARLISDLFCDGLGACIGTCPEGAITVIEREAMAYDEKTVMATIVKQGETVIVAHLDHLIGHRESDLYNQAIEYLQDHVIPIPPHKKPRDHNPFAGCPGAAAQSIARRPDANNSEPHPFGESELRQWPIQLKLLNPSNPYFDNADLLISADCVPFAYAGFHQGFLKGKILIMFCPKLDTDIDGYISKLSEILSTHTINTITVLHMEVPCCSGVISVVNQALKQSGKNIPVTEETITIQGSIKKR